MGSREDWITFNKGQSKQFTIQLRGTAIRYRIILPSIALKSGTPPFIALTREKTDRVIIRDISIQIKSHDSNIADDK